jgi:hypothetical protein
MWNVSSKLVEQKLDTFNKKMQDYSQMGYVSILTTIHCNNL